MNKIGILGMFMALSLLSCSVNPEGQYVQELNRDIIITGDPAVDASIPFLSEFELSRLGLLKHSMFFSKAVKSGTAVVTVTGPLNDRRAVRGKKISINVYVNGAVSNVIYTLSFGYASNSLTTNLVMEKNPNNNNYFKILNIPLTSPEKFYFVIKDNQGNTYNDYGNKPYQVKTYSRIVSYGFAKPFSDPSFAGYLTVNYSGPVTGSTTKLHYGWDGW